MTDETGAAPDGGAAEAAPITPITPAGEGALTAREAASFLAKHRYDQTKQNNVEAPDTGPDAADAAPLDESAQADADPQPEVPGEEAGQADPVEETQPPIEPPRSWTKEAKERFAALPRDTQDYIAQREQERDREIRRTQNEVADQRKALDAEKNELSQTRQQYEQALPALLQTLQAQQAGEFGDIKSIADIERLAREDWPRYALWDAQQKKIAAVQQEVKSSQDRQGAEQLQKWQDFAKTEDQKFADKVPEFADKAKATKLADAALSVLKEHGFADQELANLWNGQAAMSLRDHRVQLLILDGVRYREGQSKAQAARKAPIPAVQRPGVAQPRGAADDQNIQALKAKLEQTGSAKDATALLIAQRNARARRSA